MSIFTNNNLREDFVFKLKVKDVILRHGGQGALVNALLDFKARHGAAVAQGKPGIDYAQFVAYLKANSIQLSEWDASYLCRSFDDDQKGFISCRTFSRHLVGLNLRRMKAVEKAWAKLSKDADGCVARDELVEYHLNCTQSSGAPTRAASVGLDNLSTTFNNGTRTRLKGVDGVSSADSVSFEEFVAYYAGISQFVGSDESFEMDVLRQWKADQATAPCLNETERDWGEDGDPLAIAGPLYVKDALNMELGRSSKNYNYSHMKREHPYVEPLPPLDRPTIMVSTIQRTYVPYNKPQEDFSDPLVTRRGQQE